MIVIAGGEVGGAVQMGQQITDVAEAEQRPADPDVQVELLLFAF